MSSIRTPRSRSTVTRRTALAGLGAGGLGLALTAHRATAQATPEMASHPLVGTWVFDFDPADPGKVFVYLSFHADGTVTSLHPLGGPGVGTWRVTGERTGDLIEKFLNITGEAGKFEPGIVTVWGAFTVDASGESFTEESVVEVRAPDGTVVATFPFTSPAPAIRLRVETPPPLPAPEATPAT